MDEKQRNEVKVKNRQWRKDQRRRARAEKSMLYWIFDPRLHETHETSVRETEQAYWRMRIRYFFSWEGLSKFLLAPVFKIGLTSIIVTPFIASVYISVREAFGLFFDYPFPKQMGFLFFSGLSVVIARIFYELFCPKLVKAHISSSPLDTHNLQNKHWLQVELEHCLLQYVVSLPIAEDYIRGKQIRKWQKKTRVSVEEEVDDPPRYSSPVLEFAEKRVGFDVYGVWLIENLLLRIVKEKEHKLFVSWGLPQKFRECEEPEQKWDTHYTAVHYVDFCVAYEHTAEQKDMNQGDFLLEIYETDYDVVDDFPKGASIHNYFNGIHTITDLGVNDIVKEFIAENENYWKPFIRMTIAIVLLVSLFCLLSFLAIQTWIVWKAIFS